MFLFCIFNVKKCRRLSSTLFLGHKRCFSEALTCPLQFLQAFQTHLNKRRLVSGSRCCVYLRVQVCFYSRSVAGQEGVRSDQICMIWALTSLTVHCRYTPAEKHPRASKEQSAGQRERSCVGEGVIMLR